MMPVVRRKTGHPEQLKTCDVSALPQDQEEEEESKLKLAVMNGGKKKPFGLHVTVEIRGCDY